MSSWKIYSYPDNPRVWKALIAGKYNGINIEYPAFKMGTDNKSKEFLAKNPLGKVPVLETPDGCVFESNAIARYVARQGTKKLTDSTSPFESALVDQWIDFAANEIELPSAAWLFPILKIVPFHKEATNKAKADITKSMNALNTHLLTRTFLVNERITLADIVVATALYRLYKMVFDGKFRKPFPNVTRWYLTVVHQHEVQSVIGKVELCAEMQEAKEEPVAAASTSTSTTAAPAAAKPAAAGHGAAADDDDDTPKEEKKGPNPLDLLPKSNFNLDDWKRTYSNTSDIKGVAMPWFWQHFDKEGWSIYFAEYKYPEQNQVMFKTCNLIGGLVQRLDRLRKYGFGSLVIFGAEPKLEVAACWLFRGQDVPAEFTETNEYESYTFTKVTDFEAKKGLIADYWAWDGDFGGRSFTNQAKIFK